MKAVRVIGLASAKADQYGRLQVQLANGDTAYIPATAKDVFLKRSAEDARLAPDTVLPGNCGTSEVTVGPKGNDHPIRMTTGFTVDAPALQYGWEVNITGPDYSYDYNSSGFLAADNTWSGSHDSDDDYLAGQYTAVVTTGSYAALSDGTICYSGGPQEQKEVSSPDAPFGFSIVSQSPMGAASLSENEMSPTTQRAPSVGSGNTLGATPGASEADTPKRPTLVPKPYAYPATAVALVHTTFPNGTTGSCSGFMYSVNTAGTAGHCVYSAAAGGWATSITITPAISYLSVPYGTCSGTAVFSSAGFVQSADPNYDYGAIAVVCLVGSQTGTFGYDWPTNQDDSPSSTVTVNGYSLSLDATLNQLTGTAPTLSSTQRTFLYNVWTASGMSGGPVYETGGDCSPCVVGIHSSGNDTAPTPGTAVRMTQANSVNFAAWSHVT
jgi:glutamyl endopeptidase